MKITPKISIIIPVYNAEKHLDTCLQSIFKQSFTDFELILVNDGSTDASSTICESYADKDDRIKVLHQQNAGPSAARNNGIDKAKGKFITFIDADDFVDSDYLNAFLQEDVKFDKTIVIQGHKMEFSDGRIEERGFQKHLYLSSDYSDLFYDNYIIRLHPYAWNKLYPTALIKENKIYFDEDIKFGEDFIFFLNCLLYSQSILTVSYSGYNYVFNSNSLTRASHTYESEIKRLNSVRELLADISNKFSFNNKTISLHKTYLMYYFNRALNSLYLQDSSKTRKERIALLRENGKNGNYELVTKYNKPNSRFAKGFKFLFSYRFFNLLDLYSFLYYKLIKSMNSKKY